MPMMRSPASHVAREHLGPLDHADREADEIELAGLHHARDAPTSRRRATRSAPGGNRRRPPTRARRSRREPACRPRCSRGRTVARAPWAAMSSTDIATQSMPIVSRRPASAGDHRLRARRRRSTRRGADRGSASSRRANSPPNPPMSPITSGRNVERTCSLMRSTAFSPAAMSTPASAYVSRSSSGGLMRSVHARRRLASHAPRAARRSHSGLEHELGVVTREPAPGSRR